MCVNRSLFVLTVKFLCHVASGSSRPDKATVYVFSFQNENVTIKMSIQRSHANTQIFQDIRDWQTFNVVLS